MAADSPFQIGDRVRIVTDIFDEPYGLGTEHVIRQIVPMSDETSVWICVPGFSALIPSDLELVERAS